jgi:class 3 adenylate cyclase
MIPDTRYAKSSDIHIAYQLFGDGSVNLVYIPGFVSNVENNWEEPSFARWLRRLGGFARVVIFDKRGTGLSDRVEDLPSLEQRMDDARAVMDAVGFARAAVLGISEGGSLAALFAATYPDRCAALILYGAYARFTQWIPTGEALQKFFEYVESSWGSGNSMPRFAPSRQNDPAFKRWWGRFERSGGSPSAVTKLQRMNSEIEIAGILPTIRVPTLVLHRTDDPYVTVEGGRELARLIPGARLVELSGGDHLPYVGDNVDQIADLIGEFVTGSAPLAIVDRVLATILFTDIVGSTEQASAVGDQQWQDVIRSHDAAVRRELLRFRGSEVKSLGDGFLATFDGPARAIHCALAIHAAVRPLGLAVRTGLHTGEVELSGGDVRGIAVHIASRIVGLAETGQLLVSRTVKDLVAGSGISFEDFGTHPLKGISDKWQLFRVVQA